MEQGRGTWYRAEVLEPRPRVCQTGQQLICRGMAGFRWENGEVSCRNQGSDCREVGGYSGISGSSSQASQGNEKQGHQLGGRRRLEEKEHVENSHRGLRTGKDLMV